MGVGCIGCTGLGAGSVGAKGRGWVSGSVVGVSGPDAFLLRGIAMCMVTLSTTKSFSTKEFLCGDDRTGGQRDHF